MWSKLRPIRFMKRQLKACERFARTTITVVVSQPRVEHKVRVRDFEQWLEAQGRTSAEMSL